MNYFFRRCEISDAIHAHRDNGFFKNHDMWSYGKTNKQGICAAIFWVSKHKFVSDETF